MDNYLTPPTVVCYIQLTDSQAGFVLSQQSLQWIITGTSEIWSQPACLIWRKHTIQGELLGLTPLSGDIVPGLTGVVSSILL
jgi:hypothetical protein